MKLVSHDSASVFSRVLMAILVMLAIYFRDETLITLLERKFDILIQLVPAFFLGLHWPALRREGVLVGLVAGLIIALFLAFSGYGKIWGFHAGLYGLAANLVLCITISCIQKKGLDQNGRNLGRIA